MIAKFFFRSRHSRVRHSGLATPRFIRSGVFPRGLQRRYGRDHVEHDRLRHSGRVRHAESLEVMIERRFHRAQALYLRSKGRKQKAHYLGIVKRLDRELKPIEPVPATVRAPMFDIAAEAPEFIPDWALNHSDRLEMVDEL